MKGTILFSFHKNLDLLISTGTNDVITSTQPLSFRRGANVLHYTHIPLLLKENPACGIDEVNGPGA
jgi:hypothetical protein